MRGYAAATPCLVPDDAATLEAADRGFVRSNVAAGVPRRPDRTLCAVAAAEELALWQFGATPRDQALVSYSHRHDEGPKKSKQFLTFVFLWCTFRTYKPSPPRWGEPTR